MVLKTTVCRFSGLRIFPGRGILFVRVDSQQYLFLNKKCKSLFNDRKRPAKLAWTFTYRKAHKKDDQTTVVRKKRRNLNTKKPRAIVGASIEVIKGKRAEKPEVRQAARETALREVKERMKKQKAEKMARQAQAAKASKPAQHRGKGR